MQEQFTYTKNDVKQMRMIIIAVCCFITFLCIVAIAMGSAHESSAVIHNAETSEMAFRIIHAVVFLFAIFASKFIGDKILSGKIQNQGAIAQTPFMRYRTSIIVRLALLDGATLFGAVIFMQASLSGASDTTYYLHLLPLLILLLSAKSFYPTDFKLAELARAFNTD